MEDLIDKVKKSDSFQVPDGYFSELPDQVMARIEAEEKVAQVLEKYRDGHSFSVPDGYFAALPDQVMARIGAADKRRFLFRRRLITAISVAASLVLVVGIGLLWYNFQNNGTPTENMTATVVEKPVTPPATEKLTLPENALAQAVVPEQTATAPTTSKKKVAQSKNDLLEKKADDFVEKYAAEDLDVIDYEILDYFSEEDYITIFLES
ncbi:MAG: hypothetical protein IJT61_04645 [Bacteroidales bacterium]|nr:hypothetical protein [Bacteroidales bacterium]